MTSALFLGFVAVMTTLVVALIDRYTNRRAALRVLAGLVVWFLYAGLMAHFGILSNSEMRPPGITFIVVPVLVFLIFFVVRSLASARGVLAFPLWLILGTQCFRVGVELFLHQLWIEGLVPRMLTFGGANVDIYIGLSAPLIAWLSRRGRWGLKLASAWNILGLLALLNVVTRAVLTAPGPLNLIHTEVPDRMIGTFPFLLIPGFFVPLAVVLHVLAIRSIRGSLRAAYQARKEVSIRPAMTNTRNLHGLREGLPDEGRSPMRSPSDGLVSASRPAGMGSTTIPEGPVPADPIVHCIRAFCDHGPTLE